MRIKRPVLLAAALALSVAVAFTTWPPAPDHADIAYAPLSASQTFDLYLPEGPGPFPLVINIHGGGFWKGDKGMLSRKILDALRARRIAVATIDYRLTPEARFPAAIEDAKAAVRFLRANAARYRLDPERFVVFGQSAGGNLAALIGTTGNAAVFDNPALGNPGVSAHVNAVIDWYGVHDFLLMEEQARAQGCSPNHEAANSFESLYLGAPVRTVPDKVSATNPITYIDAADPPFLLQVGSEDCLVPVAQTTILADALRMAGVPVEVDQFEGTSHGDNSFWSPVFEGDANVERVADFAEAHLRKAR
ncbi:MAG: alpha/beta hydrolase [Erythrobacter sp.]|uniref:alpha/beta hydrolase n=1 Tax=Erythrobacter sp. TaxID=1042 RepID=UPI0025FEFCFB|nr:alpha/beta hydrolase [Erythrobacter sp.]MCL9999453.1 alpha/beta hydrolase [Erythrobacter sp.]